MNTPTPIRPPESVNNHNAPVTKIGDNSPQAIVNDRTGLMLSIFALVVAVLCLGLYIEGRSALERERDMVQQIIDAKIKSELAAALAPVTEQTRTAVQNSRLALDRADKQGAALEAKGLIKLENH